MASAEQRASSTGSGSPALASDGNDSFSSAASSDDHNGFSVTCTIRPSLVGRGTECRGSTLEELKAAASGDRPLDACTFVCGDDGEEMLEMSELKRHVDKGHSIMYLIHPDDPSTVFRSFNVNWSAKLYKELKGSEDGDVMENMHDWVEDRLDDLEVLSLTSANQLALRVGESFEHILDMQLGIEDVLQQLERGEYYFS